MCDRFAISLSLIKICTLFSPALEWFMKQIRLVLLRATYCLHFIAVVFFSTTIFPHGNIPRSPRSMCPDGGFFSRAFKWVLAHSSLISALTHCRGIQLSPLTPLRATFLNAMLDSGLTQNASTTVPLTNIQKLCSLHRGGYIWSV